LERISNGYRHEQLTLKASALREELHSALEKIISDTVSFKLHIQKSLDDYENLVSEEIELELERAEERERENAEDVEMA